MPCFQTVSQNTHAATEVGTNCVDAAVGDNVENKDKLLRSVAEMIDSFSQVGVNKSVTEIIESFS